jgi:hypothetical protein
VALDNSTFEQKVTIRREALKLAGDSPVIMETHGGTGKLFEACYLGQRRGVVFELDGKRAAILAAQRPTWAVYEADCVRAIKLGVGGHLEVNLLDLDPYGSPWGAIEAFFSSERSRPARLVVVVNDGQRREVQMMNAWKYEALKGMVAKYGNDLHPIYLDICRELLQEKAAMAGYRLDRFWGYYTGHHQQITHYLGVLEQA